MPLPAKGEDPKKIRRKVAYFRGPDPSLGKWQFTLRFIPEELRAYELYAATDTNHIACYLSISSARGFSELAPRGRPANATSDR